ncbi:histidine phosphatase family protein [Algoriphagus halophytocola]|uniref:Histidine phosphatase family protein n=1 Tax=Algoriphagus halophytocola TaxID=2991499 RepID=A0ABY6MMY2_9BACT|nr:MULTISPECIES: histidine phosphatase family protein [unclassified Algoriphagus]UZD23752.1 histidine phosphatase family protein [Algoriphagus sp. TR-M5]WBL45046.1 histidine phosphatase family protein [Algoriphagus sp. TR-M9]
MKHLILLRHGEAGFSQGSDFQRKLTLNGREQLGRLSKSLDNTFLSVDFMHCSEANRTRETAELIGKHLEIKDANFSRSIYEGDVQQLISLLEETPNSANTCLLIGHNPTISLLLAHITNQSYLGMQPGMMAILNLEISDWKMIGLGTGTLREIKQ